MRAPKSASRVAHISYLFMLSAQRRRGVVLRTYMTAGLTLVQMFSPTVSSYIGLYWVFRESLLCGSTQLVPHFGYTFAG